MSSTNNAECSLCVSEKKRSELYSHTCDNLICYECIFTNILFHLRIECPYCRVDYSKNELKVLLKKKKVLFNKLNNQSTEKMMTACESGYDMINSCMNQVKLFEKMGFFGTKVIAYMELITKALIILPFRFVLAMQKDAKNILILEYSNLWLLAKYSIGTTFFQIMGTDRFVLYDRRDDCDAIIRVYSIDVLNSVLTQRAEYPGKITIEPIEVFINKMINGNSVVTSKLFNQDASVSLRVTIKDESSAITLINSLQQIITLAAPEKVISNNEGMIQCATTIEHFKKASKKASKTKKNHARNIRRRNKLKLDRANSITV